MPSRPKAHISEALADPRASFHSHAVVAGELVFVSGSIARRHDSGLHEGVSLGNDGEVIHDVAEQFRSAMKEVLEVLSGLGADLNCIVEVCAYLTDLKRDFASFNAAYGDLFREWLPARTTVEVAGLPSNVCIELKVTAVLP